MKLTLILAFTTIIAFVILFFINKSSRRFYLLFILFTLPIIDLPISPEKWGSLKVFDGITLISGLFFYKDLFSTGKQNNSLYLFFLFIGTLILGSLFSEFPLNSIINILPIISIFIYCKILIRECSLDWAFQERIVEVIKLIGIFSMLFLLVQLFFGLDITFYPELNRNTIDPNGFRYPSFFHDPQKFAVYLAMLCFISLITFANKKEPDTKNYLVLFLFVGGMIATGSRSAFLGLFAGFFLLFFVMDKQFKLVFLSLFIIGSFIIINYSNSILILNRSQNLREDLMFRKSLWDEGLKVYQEHPEVGIGIGNFKNYAIAHSNNYFITPAKDVVFFDQPESGYLMLLIETGTFGFIMFLLYFMFPIIKCSKNMVIGKLDKNKYFSIAGILCFSISFVSLYSISDKRILVIVATLIGFVYLTNQRKFIHVF